MAVALQSLSQQVMVITGASSGIGLATARAAAEGGARLVLCARNQEALAAIEAELRGQGVEVLAVEADVARLEDVQELARRTIGRFGRIDTWVNNAGVSIFGRLWEVPMGDLRRLFEVNFWGVVYGSQVALAHMREHGGAIINIGSILSEKAFPLQGMYSASKHAVKAYTDALRMEVEHDDLPVSVTLLKPAAIDTLFTEHARSYTGREPQIPPPLYAPSVVADAIVHAAQRPVRDMVVGGAGKFLTVSGRVAPRLTEKFLERRMIEAQMGVGEPGGDALESPGRGGRERGWQSPAVFERSLYTRARMHPTMTTAGLALGALAVALAIRAARRR